MAGVPRGYAVVAGGSRGIGRATALLLAEEGYAVAVAYKSRDDAARETVRLALTRGAPQAFAVRADLSTPEGAERLAERVAGRFPHVNVLVYSAGVLQLGGVEELDPETWDEVVRVNLSGAFYTVKALLPLILKAPWASIVFVSSIAGQTGNVVAGAAYAASKAGLIGLAKRLAVELAPRGVRVNAVAPSFVETDMTRDILSDPRRREEIRRLHPLGVILKPEDVAKTILYLADPERSPGVTGAVVPINGGRYT